MSLFQLLGLTLISVSEHNIQYKKALRLVNLVWMMGSIGVFVYLTVECKFFNRNYSRMTDIFSIVNYLIALGCNIFILLHVQMVKNSDIQFNEKLHKMDRISSEYFKHNINYRTLNKTCLLKLCVTLCAVFMCVSVNVFYSIKKHDLPLFVVHNCFLILIINLRYMQNFLAIDAMKARIICLHKTIQQILQHNTIEWKIVLVVDTQKHCHNVQRKIDDPIDVVMFKQFYATLYESMKLMEDCFGWSQLFQITYSFINLTSNLYWFFIAILNLDSSINVVNCCFKIAPSVALICMLIQSSFDCNRKMKNTINLVSKLYTMTTSDYNHMVKEFLMQIIHIPIEISANDFFNIDFHLFSAVRNTIIQKQRFNDRIYKQYL